MVKSVIKKWGDLVNALLRQEKTSSVVYIEDLSLAKEETFIDILVQTGNAKSEEELRLLILAYQSSVNYILNKLSVIHANNASLPANQSHLVHLRRVLWEIIEFLSKSFSRFFNEDIELPLICQDLTAQLLGQITQKLVLLLVEDNLIKLVNNTLTTWLDRKEEKVTFRKLSYLQSLFRSLNSYSINLATPTNAVTELFLIYNFNSLEFIKFVVESIGKELLSEDSAAAKALLLKSYLRKVYRFPVKSTMALYPEESSSIYVLINWLEQEISYWGNGLEANRRTDDSSEVTKITTSLSVPVLALISRMQKDAGIITAKSNAEYIRFVASHYTSARKEDISFGHLHSAYYSIDEAAKRKAYDYFMTMAQMVKKIK